MRGICLCSGGLDSTLALIRLLEKGHEIVPFYVNFKQWSDAPEHEAFHAVTEWCHKIYGDKVLSPVCIAVNWAGEEDEQGVGSAWGRGIMLVGLASVWAYTHGDSFDVIALGNHKGDVGPDCKPGTFDANLDQALLDATKGKMDLVLPIRDLTIEEIGIELESLDHDLLKITYSCYWSPPCGFKSKNEAYRCPGCRRKTIAMKAAGITDPDRLDFPNGVKRSYQADRAERTVY